MPTWDALAVTWVDGRVRRREIQPITGRNHICALKPFVQIIGNAKTIRRDHVDRWLESRSMAKASTVRSDFSAIRGWCGWLAYEGTISRDPTFGKKPPKEPRRIPRYIEPADVGAIFAMPVDARMYAMCWLMYGAGLRCCEVAGIQIGDYDRRARVVRVTGKGGHQREAALPKQAVEAVDRYLAEWPATVGPLFRSYRHHCAGLKAGTVSKMTGTLMAEAGVKHAARDGVSAHAFRHTAASDLLTASDGNLWLVAEQLGHANLGTLRVYLRHARSDETRAAMEGREYPGDAPAPVAQIA